MKYPETESRIYRDVHRGMISGVCAGLARYAGIDVLWVRIAAVFAMLFLNVPAILAYIAATFLLPRR